MILTRFAWKKYHKETSCVAIFISNKKNVIFLFFFFNLSFLFCKTGEQKGRKGPTQGIGLAPVGGGRWWGKRVGE
jgi:hypothetical protein